MRRFWGALAGMAVLVHAVPSLADTSVGGRISADTTWTLSGSPYLVTSSIQIYGSATSPVTLAIEPGVTVKFNPNTYIQIGDSASQGALVAQGTATDRITFTRSGSTGNWGSITFNDPTVDATTILENVDIQYSSGVTINSSSPTIRNSSITNVSGNGLYLTSANPVIDTVTITSTGSYGIYLSSSSPTITGCSVTNSYTGGYGLYLSSSNPTINNVTITNNGSYGIYLSSSSPTITGGSLTNASTTGHGIYGSGSPVISNYTVSSANSAGIYGLYLSNATSALSVTNSTISNGLYLGSTGIIPTVTGNTFTNLDNSPVHAGANIIGQLLDNNTFTGMSSAGKIEVTGEDIRQDARWKKWAAPYNLLSGISIYKDATTPATLTIDPGVTIKVANGTINVGYSTSKGALVAQGTSTDRITFIRSGSTGNWGSITFNDPTVDATTILENVDIQYSSGVTINSSSPIIRNSTITNVSGYGLNLSSSSPIIDTVTITNNGTYGIYLSSSSPTITGGSLTNTSTTGHGIYGGGSPVISNYTVSSANSAGIYGLYLSSTTSALSVTNSTISNGLYLGSTGITPTVTGNTFTNLDNSPVHGGANIIGQLLDNNTFTGMSSAGKIEVTGEDIRQDARWKKWAAPYNLLSGISIYKDATTPATLTIDPGVTIKVANGTINVGYNSSKGALVARGTATDRIVITRSSTTGNWGSLTFNDPTVDASTVFEYADILYSTGVSITSASPTFRNCTMTDMVGYVSLSSANPVLENVTIANSSSYGIYINSSSPTITGGSLVNSYTGGYGIYGSGSPVIANYSLSIVNSAGKYGLYVSNTTSAFSVTNSTIGNGLYLGSTGITPTVTGNTFTNGDNAPPHAGANIVAQLLDANTFTGLTSAGKVEVVGEQINRDTLWRKLAAPYWVVSGNVSVYKDTVTPATLTIEPGTTLKFAVNCGLQIGNGTSKGALIARGTATDRTVFTRSAATGNWGSLSFSDGTIDATTAIEYADIQYSGNISLTSASPVFRNSTINDLNGYLNLNSANPTLDNITISSISPSYGIYLGSSSPVISGGSLTVSGSGANGIYGYGSPVISNYSVTIVNSAGKYGLYLSTTTSTLSVTNSTIGNGLYINSTAISPTITGNTFTNSDNAPLHAGANIVTQLLDNNTFTGLTTAGKIEVVGEQVNRDTLWQKLVAPYWVIGTVSIYKDTVSPATLTIEPGTTVKFASGSGIQIGSGTSKGALVAQGTANDHIVFTRSAATGNWGSLTFSDGTIDATTALEYLDMPYSTGISITSASPTFRNCTMTDMAGYMSLSSSNSVLENVAIANNSSYGVYLSSSSPTITGGSLANSYTGGYGIYAYSSSPIISNYNVSIVNSAGKYGLYLSSSASALSVTNSTIGNGLYLGTTGILPTITGNTFTNSDNSPLHAGANIIGAILNNNTFTGMTAAGKIEVTGETINQDATWKKWGSPYLLQGTVYVYKDTATAATLTVEAGVVLKFNSGTGIQAGYGASLGKLVAVGTALDPVIFTSSAATPAPGNWIGLTLNGDAAAGSLLDNVVIEYGGAGGVYNNANLSFNGASTRVANSIIRNSAGSGVYLVNAAKVPEVKGVELTGNKWGIYSVSSNPVIENCRIYNNTSGGVTNASTSGEIDARGNWWGAATGPTHASNPGGTGSIASDRVIYNPWLTQSPTGALAITTPRANPAAFNPDGGYTTVSAGLSGSAAWTMTVSSGATPIRTVTGSGALLDQRWYGDDDTLAKVADGTYSYRVDLTASGGGATLASLAGRVSTARGLPQALLTVPADNQMFVGGTTIAVTGSAFDAVDFKNYILEYGAGDPPATWSQLATATTPVNNALFTNWYTSGLPGGLYTLRLTVSDNAGTTLQAVSRVRLLWLQGGSATAGYISPNGDGLKDTSTISASFTHPVAWTVSFKNSGGTVVNSFTGNGTSLSQIWDGKDSGGAVVPDGSYTWQIDAVNQETGVTLPAKTGTIVVDVTAPQTVVTAPTSGTALRHTVNILGTAADSNLDSYKIEYALAGGGWTLLATSGTSVTGGTLGVWITNDQRNLVLLANGDYTLRLSATDKAGNSSVTSLPVTVDNLILSGISVTSHTLDSNAGETVTVSYSINSPATVTLKVVPERSGPTGAPIYSASLSCLATGTCSFSWDGKDAPGKAVPDEAYLYVLEAADATRTDSYAPAVIVGASVSCSQGAYYNPYKNIPMTINYYVANPARVNIKIYWGSQNFTIMDGVPHGGGSYIYNWDGRDPSGEIMPGGSYPSCTMASAMQENYIITSGNTPRVTLLKTDPYSMSLSYGQFSRIKYTLPAQANVTIRVISPSGGSAILADNVPQVAGDYELEWLLADLTDADGKKFVVSAEGDYTVSVQAVNPATGASYTAKGNLTVGL